MDKTNFSSSFFFSSTHSGWFQGIKSCGTAIGVGFSGFFISLELHYYASTWTLLIVPALFVAFFSFLGPETLQPTVTRRRQSILKRESLTNPQDLIVSLSSLDGDTGSNGASKTDNQSKLYKCCCSPFRLCLGSRTITIVAAFIFLFTLGGSALVIVQAYMTIAFGLTATEVFAIGACAGIVAFISLTCAGCILPLLGALLGMGVAAGLATLGLTLMAISIFIHAFFYIGMLVMASSLFGVVAYLQFISARFDPSQMGALQGALAASALLGFIIGSNLFTALSVLPDFPKPMVFVIGACFMFVGTVMIFYLRCTRAKESREGGEGGNGDRSQVEYAAAEVDSNGGI